MAKLKMDGTHEGLMIANSTARDLHLVRTAQVAGEAFGYHAPADAGAARWGRPALALLLMGFLITAAYLAY
jgi:hypothetical protein